MNPLRPTSPLFGPLLALAVACMLTGSIVPAFPSGLLAADLPDPAAASLPDIGALPPEAARVADAGQDLLALAAGIGQAGGPSAALAAAGVLPAPQAGPAVRSPDLAAALARLDPASGSADAALAGLDAAEARALVPLVDAVADAGALVEQAFARLTPQERTLVLGHLLDPAGDEATPEQSEAARLTALVDPAPMAQAAQGILAAAEGFLATRVAPPGGLSSGVPALPMAMAGACSPAGFSFISPGGLVEVGFTGSNSYLTERLLIVDLDGDDCYENYPAAVGPGSPYPLSVILDAGGNDLYYTDIDHASPQPGSSWSAGVGIGGVGLIVDRWGNDNYFASLSDDPHNCNAYGGYPDARSWQRLYAQGVGILGVGGIADLGGDDRYSASSSNAVPDPLCNSNHTYAYAQGSGNRLGVGFLLDSTGNDRYGVSASASDTWVSNAHAHGQGTAATRGIGALIDEEGNDVYNTGSGSTLAPGFQGAATAYTFAQASLYNTKEPRGEGVTPPDCKLLPQLCQVNCDVQVVCNLVGQPVTPVGPRLSADLCNVADVSPGAGPGIAVGEPCDLPALALLVDVEGRDRYVADSFAAGAGLDCAEAVWAATSAQGSAPTKGAALLADADLDTDNAFTATSTADAKGCQPYGVRASTLSQGYGGALLWDLYDRPPFDPLLVTDLATGLLARGGVCGRSLDFSGALAGIAVNLDPDDPCDAAWANDSYFADATANNPGVGGLAWAQTRAQGSGNGDLGTFPSPAVPGGPYQALGIGGHLDLFGDDDYTATAHATAPAGTAAPFTAAQAAATTAVGVLVNIGDVDDYFAMSYLNGPATLPVPQTTQWSLPYVLAQADSTVPAPVILVTVGIAFAGINDAVAVLVDLFGGANDFYSLAPYCPNNGAFPAFPYIWGNQNVVTQNLNLGPPTPCSPPAVNYDNNAPGSPGPGTAGAALGIDW